MHQLISIILLNYNSYNHTIECIESIKNNDYDNYEIIVVDNYSTDESVKYLEMFCCENIYLIKNAKNSGFAAGNNLGIKMAIEHQAEYILLLNNDTIICEDTLTTLVSIFERCKDNTSIVTCMILNYYDRNLIWYGGGEIKDSKGDAIGTQFGKSIEKGYEHVNKEVTFASGCCMFIPQKVFQEVGLLPEDYFLYYEDMEFCKMVTKSNKKILFTSETCIYHKESISTKKNSPNYVYYFCRNRLQFIKNNILGYHRLLAFVYTYLWIMKKIIFDHYSFKDSFSGVRDFFWGRLGKRIDE